VTDYRRFLGTSTEEVWPYFGGPFVETGSRRLRLAEPTQPGYWRFSITGRTARTLGPAEAPDLGHLPAVRGHAVHGYLAVGGGAAELLALGPPDEPLLFAPEVARRWPSGELIFDAWDFESGVEDQVREAYESRGTLAAVKGAPAALRAAFGYAVLLRTAEEQGVPAQPAEARAHLAALADEGEPAARRILGLLQAEREAELAARRAAAREANRSDWVQARDAARPRHVNRRSDQARNNTEDRAADALFAARAGVRGMRWLHGDLLEVRYDLDGVRLVSIVESVTLRVVDAGICLSGHDRDLTLESLPSAIREAANSGRLNITAW
jgi:hypothetical protein